MVRDANGNRVGGFVDPDFSIDLGATDAIRTTVVATTPPGTYEFDVANMTPENVTVTVTVEDVTLDDAPEITFVTGE